MPITTRLSRKLRQTLGEEATEDLVNWMHESDTNRAELGELNARLAELREASRADLAELHQEMQAGFAKTDQTLQAGLAELRQELHVGLSRVETKLEQRTADLMKWSFVFWVGAVGAIAVLAGVLR